RRPARRPAGAGASHDRRHPHGAKSPARLGGPGGRPRPCAVLAARGRREVDRHLRVGPPAAARHPECEQIMKYQRIYDRMPLLGQHAMATLYGYKNKRVRFGGEYRPRLEFLRAFASLDRAEQEEYQRRELQAFVAHAATRSAFYRRLYAGVPWQKVRRVEDLALLPVVTKEQIRSNIVDVITVERSKGVSTPTGGIIATSLETLVT